MYKRRVGFKLRDLRGFRGYLMGMAVEGAATLVLMGMGLVISILGYYLL